MKTKTEETMYGKHPMIAIHDETESGAISEKSIIQFGIKKAEAILAHIEEIKAFVEKNKK